METAQTDLVITGAHTDHPAVYWKGQSVQNFTDLKLVKGVVTLTVPEEPILAEMIAAGIKIMRVPA